MAVYIVVASDKPDEFKSIVEEKILQQNRYKVDDKTWFISPPDTVVTAKQLSDYLDVSSGTGGKVVISLLSAYYGYHNRETWSWLQSKGV